MRTSLDVRIKFVGHGHCLPSQTQTLLSVKLSTPAPLKVRKSIPRTTFGLTLATRKVFQKILINLPCPLPGTLRLSFHRYSAWCRRFSALQYQKTSQGAPGLTRRPSFLAKVGCMALTPLSESSRANTDFLGRW